MSSEICRLLGQTNEDSWRQEVGFSPEVQEALETCQPDATDDEIIVALDRWLSRYQPCLFGRIAAKAGLIHYCLLRDEDLRRTDAHIKDKIQDERKKWTRLGFEGKASGFVIVLLSSRLNTALPSATIRAIALRVCSLYLLEEIESDQICLDHIYLEQPGSKRTTWEWAAGINYFSAQGDKRWWQDHRIPAGMAFSVNSVGHMVKSGRLAKAYRDLEELMGTAAGDFRNPKVDSLAKALELAMRTIDLASSGPSGRATTLLPLAPDTESMLRCPIELPASLTNKNHCEYEGDYHTDFTVPSEYFRPDVLRPKGMHRHRLDFTYLFNKDVDNPDFDLMGAGRPIRDAELNFQADAQRLKRLRGLEREVLVDDIPRLREALRG